MKKGVLILVGVIAVIAIAANFMLPRAAEVMLERKLPSMPELQGVYEAKVEAKPGLMLALGKFDRISFNGANLKIGSLNVASYSMSTNSGGLDLIQSFKDKSLVLKNQQMVDMSLYITKQDLTEWLSSYYPSINDFNVSLGSNTITITGNADVLGLRLPLSMESSMLVSGHNTLILTVEDVVLNTAVDDSILANLQRIFSIEIDLRRTTPPTYIDTVEIRDTGIYVEATTELIKTP